MKKECTYWVIMTDITNYAEALREVSAARKEVQVEEDIQVIYILTYPPKKKKQHFYERAGRLRGKEGSNYSNSYFNNARR